MMGHDGKVGTHRLHGGAEWGYRLETCEACCRPGGVADGILFPTAAGSASTAAGLTIRPEYDELGELFTRSFVLHLLRKPDYRNSGTPQQPKVA